MLPNNHSQEDVITAPALKTLHLLATNLNVCPFLLYGLADKNATAPGSRGQVPKPSPDKTDEEALSFHSEWSSIQHRLFPLPQHHGNMSGLTVKGALG